MVFSDSEKFSEKKIFLTDFWPFFGQILARRKNLMGAPNLQENSDNFLGNVSIGLKLHINVPGDMCDKYYYTEF